MGRGVMIVLGLSHQTAALAAREQVALDDARARTVLRALRADRDIREAAVLSTCNRTEVYAVAASADAGERALRRAVLEHTSLGAATLSRAAYTLLEEDAAEHLFRVAAGLESAILGETEIGGQVRAAAQRARQEECLGVLLAGAFERASTASRRVRRRTGISAGATSVASVVSALIAGVRPSPGRRIVLLGAGRLARSLAGALAGVPAAELVVVNRSQAAACELADRCGSRAAGLDRLEAELRRADALVCATGAPRPTVGAGAVERAVAGRRRPLLIVDLAVPRDVEPAAANVPGVALHDIDAVQQHVSRNTSARRRAAMAAGSMVRHEATRFTTWRRELEAAAALQVVWRQAEELRRAELTRHGEGALSAPERERLDQVTACLMRRLLHGPSERLREACAKPGAAAHVESFRMLFGVDPARAPAADLIALAQREAA